MNITLLQGKRIVLGVTGSIACYKVVDLASKLTQAGAEVDVIMTEAAQKFVAPLTFRSVTGRPVYTDMWAQDKHVPHVGLGEEADLLMIAPATAHTMAKLAHGMADNLLTVTVLAARCPILVAPAMDGGMYEHGATQANVALLRQRGILFAGPTVGRMASGLSGLGRMLESEELLGHCRQALARDGVLAGRKVVVTAGPTRENLDPVRYISNRSTGRQGVAVAQAALDLGARVILVAGPLTVATPFGATVIDVETAQEMHDAVLGNIMEADVLCMVAAVADFRPRDRQEQKIKKTKAEEWGMAIGLEKTLDVLTSVRGRREETGYPVVTLGFAAETQDAFEYGRSKLLRKGLSLIAVNDVTAEGAGFGVDTNRVVLLGSTGVVERMEKMSKAGVAERLMTHVVKALGVEVLG
ncbi:MAG TPA: bifunctional phosphopantothenoylcysteine decarboxylase/phosphopantothenate--cysteine ligase CoaBC [Anaerolineae bacterium]|nr:bifunctional phosphopantothenoylcysteine decarboxylase/phosphopantothenate--cysteine ligase CoaBC [Anaerolineae bacterium]